MAISPQPLTNMLRLAAAAFGEAQRSFAECDGMTKEEAKPILGYAWSVTASGLAQVEAMSKQYAGFPECARNEPAKPILSDAQFRGAVAECASTLEPLAASMPALGKVAASLRRFVETNNPAEARILAMACDAVSKAAKTAGARAAL